MYRIRSINTLPKSFYNIIYLSIFATLFFGANVLNYFGYKIGNENSSTYEKFFPSLILATTALLFRLSFVRFKKKSRVIKITKDFLIYSVVLLLYLLYNKIDGGLSFIPNTIIIPLILSLCLYVFNVNELQKLRYIILLFFVINCLTAIVESSISTHFFPSSIENLDYNGFRSTALQNHPLNNALITATIMVFILISNLKVLHKYILFFLGFASIVCYGSRSSMLICSFILILFILKYSFFEKSVSQNQQLQKIFTYILIIFGISLVLYLITSTQFGERLMNKLYFDDSASVRLDIFNVFDVINYQDLLWGSSQTDTEILTEGIGIATIENFWLAWIIRFGIIFGTILIIYFIYFCYVSLDDYNFFDKTLILLTFFGISSTNLSLGSNTAAISIFVICAYAFKSNMLKKYKFITVKR